MSHEPLHPDTIAVVAGRPARAPGAPLNAPIVPASTYHHGGEPVYGRDGNPGWAAFEQALGDLEGGSCVAFSTGLAASSAILDELAAGVRVVAQRAPYFGLVWAESPTNPMLDVVAQPAVIGIARAAGARVVVDITFATPLGQNPL